ncbi:MAG: hypothetical protein HQK98_05150 [Nitrospirae bacterium]|nr:hypothetical protein [Nitrospirota bacterium]
MTDEEKLKADLDRYKPWPEMFYLPKTKKVRLTIFCNFWAFDRIQANLLGDDQNPIDFSIPYHVLHDMEIEVPPDACMLTVRIEDVKT